ncbi:MAG: class A beta-lactamase-related serine hydrolase [Thermodesulfobacteriales bacterium]|nr:MAG: class A beta-lactamase-related serine hydrolase [Thermodesulfobacteriales bacterium]
MNIRTKQWREFMLTNYRIRFADSLKRTATLILIFTILSFFLISSSCDSDSNSSLDPELAQRLEEILLENMEEFGIPGALVGVWIPGEGNLIIEQGVSDIDNDKPIEKNDHVRIGSVTKSFTVTVILQLVGEGLLSLDDPLSKFFPEIENSDATVRDLANMRSGIFNYTEDNEFVMLLIQDLLRKWAPQELVDVADDNLPYFAPDGGWHYSNTNTVILGMIIEQVTGNFVGDEIQKRIIEPLGLSGTIYPISPDIPSPFSRGYAEFDPEVGLMDVTFSDPSASAGSGAMISKLSDLRIWGEALGKGTLLNKETHQVQINSLSPIVFDPCDDDDPERAKRSCPEYDKYGLGIGELNGWIGHTGEYIGYTALVMYEPESGAVVVILMNIFGVGDHVPTKVFREYAEILN